jgi:hypothetical protein
MFLIVSFDETDETEFVPLHWIADGTKVADIKNVIKQKTTVKFYWPPMKCERAVVKAQTCAVDPDIKWPIYNGRILTTASKKLPLYHNVEFHFLNCSFFSC